MWHVLKISSERFETRRSSPDISQANRSIMMQIAASAFDLLIWCSAGYMQYFHTATQP
jgi:hypothetical protein